MSSLFYDLVVFFCGVCLIYLLKASLRFSMRFNKSSSASINQSGRNFDSVVATSSAAAVMCSSKSSMVVILRITLAQN